MKAIKSQNDLPSIQGIRNISYAGAWTRYGFHEDGFTSGLAAVRNNIYGIRMPFEIEYAERKPARMAVLGAFLDFIQVSGLRAFVGWAGGWWLAFIRLILSLIFDLRHLA